MTRRTRLLGKFRGTVANTADPLNLGRIQASVPGVTGPGATVWAMPCFPVAGMFTVPGIGANVWIEFERGDLDYPIWTGCFYLDEADVPAVGDAIPSNGGLILRSASGATVIVDETGIHIANGQGASLALTGPSVTINNGALSVV